MTREEKEQTGKYVLQMARLLEDGCYQQEMLLKAVNIIDEALDQEPTTKKCESCRYYGSHHEVCNYCYKCSLWTEHEPATKNDLGVNKLISDCEKMSFDIEIFNKPLKVVALDAVKNIVKDMSSVPPQEPRWIPVSERPPKDLEPVNITWINHDPEPYYNDIKDKPFTATGVYFNGQWYWWSTLCTDILAEYGHNYDDIIDDAIEVTAWMPLPKGYEEVKE